MTKAEMQARKDVGTRRAIRIAGELAKKGIKTPSYDYHISGRGPDPFVCISFDDLEKLLGIEY